MKRIMSVLRSPYMVWACRIILGATFMLSGVTKMIDPWGTMIKIQAYVDAWHMTAAVGSGFALAAAVLLSLVEFVTGLLVFTGSLRRTAPFAAFAIMLFMLPLSYHIYRDNPVSDCGCFGDFWVISNGATFAKNIMLMIIATYLLVFNKHGKHMFAPWVQWMQITVAVIYMLIIGAVGYFVQPLIDFRPYPVGEPLVNSDDEAGDMVYTYRNAKGQTRTFPSDSIPDEDSGWQYVTATPVGGDSGKMLELTDWRTGDDVTSEVLGSRPVQLVLLIPHFNPAAVAAGYIANDLERDMTERYGNGSFVAVTEGDSATVARGLDRMMASYPVYTADSKAMQAAARGDMAVIALRNDTVMWKRNLWSVNPRTLLNPDVDPATEYVTHGKSQFWRLTFIFVLLELAIAWLGTFTTLSCRLPRRVAPRGIEPRSKV